MIIRISILLTFIFYSALYCYPQNKTDNDSTVLLSMYVETLDSEEPTCEMIEHPEGSFGIGIINDKKVPGRVFVTHMNDTLYDSGQYISKQQGMTIKVRGNTSAGNDKKPFKIKLQKAYDLLFRNNPQYDDKDWILLRSGCELNTMTGFMVNSIVNKGEWTPAYKYVNLYMNNNYRGVYILCESIERENNCRIYVDKSEGYIFELDPYWWLEDVYFDTSFTNATKRFTFKYPDSDDIEDSQIEYIQSYMQEVEKAIKAGNYSDYIDVESFARWLIAHEILGTWDSAGSNIYLMKKDNSSKVKMATLWDFDMILKTKDQWARVHYDYFYYGMLFNNVNKEFVRTYKNVWEETRDLYYNNIIEILSAFPDSQEGIALDKYISLDNARWGYSNKSVEEQVEEFISWFTNRRVWLDKAISALDGRDNYNNIVFTESTLDGNNCVYDIYGRNIDYPHKGIYIVDGKKYIAH